ncbi:MAG: lipoprotein [Burkholderiaceae bacterium]|nr:lipoprotein [Burkholderiaceae bacterium]
MPSSCPGASLRASNTGTPRAARSRRRVGRLAATLAAAFVLLAGCGQRGPLYLPTPGSEPKKKTSQAAPQGPLRADTPPVATPSGQ